MSLVRLHLHLDVQATPWLSERTVGWPTCHESVEQRSFRFAWILGDEQRFRFSEALSGLYIQPPWKKTAFAEEVESAGAKSRHPAADTPTHARA
ncbi:MULTISPECIES: hypothetical protein [Cupriavidus]|jgi:hypothetical protein|uniref:Uncharacterized protein n=1 Tax=Cupriavidus metallidurans TaxID=119219 RepID=A0A482IQZ0_9BURK|nr:MULTISPECIES: hypothetical protein [Cupriavidus]QBP09947.1 hypothetical protein DDF84_009315 [Cupriavidus metallidurans]